MNKLNLRYKLHIEVKSLTSETQNDILKIEYPLKIEFHAKRNSLAEANTLNLKIYNLSEANRDRIYHDPYRFRELRHLELFAGYENNLMSIFNGDIRLALSKREGTNIITEIQAYDGGYELTNGFSSFSMPKNTKILNIAERFSKDFGFSFYKIGNFTNYTSRGMSFYGKTFNICSNLFYQDDFFVDQNIIHFMKRHEVIKRSNQYLYQISTDTGLLEAPLRYNTTIMLTMLFDPRFFVKQYINLKSIINSRFNGDYAVTGIEHLGTISGLGENEARTTLYIWNGIDKEIEEI